MEPLNPAPALLLTIDETAALLKLSRTKTYDMAKRGEIPTRRFGRSVRVPVADLHRWLREGGKDAA